MSRSRLPEPTRIEVRRGARGRAVHACAAFRRGVVVERAPIIVVARDYWRSPRAAREWAYYWRGACAIALGFGSLYNHSYAPNLGWRCRYREQVIEYTALRAIAAGEELTINYNGHPGHDGPMDFDVSEPVTRASRRTARPRSRRPSG